MDHPRWAGGSLATLRFVNGFYATFEREDGSKHSESLEKIIISWDDRNNRPQVTIRV